MDTESFNSQYSSPPFGLPGDYASSGAAGTQGVTDQPAGVGGGPVIGRPVISAPYGSSQLDVNMPEIPVTAGDTSAMSDDMPAHASAIMPGPAAAYMDSGASK